MFFISVFRLLASVDVEVPDLAVGKVSLMIMCHLLSKLAPLMISALRSLFRAVFREAMVRNGVISSLALLKMIGIREDISEAIVFLAV